MPPASAKNIRRRLATRRFSANNSLRSNYQHAVSHAYGSLPQAERACTAARASRNHATKQLCKRYDELRQELADLEQLRQYVLRM